MTNITFLNYGIDPPTDPMNNLIKEFLLASIPDYHPNMKNTNSTVYRLNVPVVGEIGWWKVVDQNNISVRITEMKKLRKAVHILKRELHIIICLICLG